MNAVKLFKKSHQEFLRLIHEFVANDGVSADTCRRETFDNLEEAFSFYAAIKEQIFYPELEKTEETKHLIQKSKKELHRIKEILSKMKSESGDWKNNLSELKESVCDYVKKEETEVFPKVERVLGDKELKKIGKKNRKNG